MILDATTSYRAMWTGKQDQAAVFLDKRREVEPDVCCLADKSRGRGLDLVTFSLRGWIRSLRYYRCWKCGAEVLKAAAKLSGGPGYEFGWHVHCPNKKCDAIIACDLYFWRVSPY